MPGIMENFVPVASTYAADIDWIWELIFWIVGFWFVLSEGVFFWLLWKFRHKEGRKAQYVTGELQSEKKWITYPHLLVLVCDIFIVYGAVIVGHTAYVLQGRCPSGHRSDNEDELMNILGSFRLAHPPGS